MFVINSSFMGSFKVGDNIVYNLEILSVLYAHYAKTASERRLLRKPIIVLIVSIIEAVLYDLHSRIKTFTIEGVQNLGSDVLAHIRLKQIDAFAKYIASAKKHDFFDAADSSFYEHLDDLRRLRNRVHIQNESGDFEPDEPKAFSTPRMRMSEEVLEKILRIMASKYARKQNHVSDFVLPWDPRFAVTSA